MACTESHNRAVGFTREHREQLWAITCRQARQPDFLKTHDLDVRLKAFEAISLYGPSGDDKKVPDYIAGFCVGHREIITSFVEVAKSQGLYTTPGSKLTKGKDGVLNKVGSLFGARDAT